MTRTDALMRVGVIRSALELMLERSATSSPRAQADLRLDIEALREAEAALMAAWFSAEQEAPDG
jgi:hypothetical protein